jgi:NAD(P)-dependent dehydrogenase (short-subunit alcohol dehydrogenase family)
MTETSDFDLAGRTALVTGSSEGIGRAVALRLARAGAEVIVHGLPGGADGRAVVAEIEAAGGRARPVEGDFSRLEDVEAVLAAAGPVDILVSNVAIQERQPLGEVDAAAMERQFRVNVISAVTLIQGVLPSMRARKWGRIVTVGSVQEFVPNPVMLIYAGLKSAQTNMVRSIARQVAADGVTVNTVAPGIILTGRSRPVLEDPAYAATMLAKVPAGVFGEAEDVAGAVLLLCSEAGRYITGANIPVDGGMSL